MRSLKDKKIILLDDNGVASLDIQRLKKEMADQEPVSHNLMPEQIVKITLSQLKQAVEDLENNKVSSIFMVKIGRHTNGLMRGEVTVSIAPNEAENVQYLVNATLNNLPPEGAG